MSEALAPMARDYSSLEDFAAYANLTTEEAIALLNNADFINGVQRETKARARVAFHARGIERLIAIAGGADDKAAMTAITLLGKLAGEFKAPRPVMLSFEELRKTAATVPAGPLGGITQITESAVIDAEEEEDDESD